MEDSFENWDLHMEMNDCDAGFLDTCHPDGDDEFLRDIFQQQPPTFSSESESDHSFHAVHTIFDAASDGVVLSPEDIMVKSNSSDSLVCDSAKSDGVVLSSEDNMVKIKKPRRSASPRTYILSFDNSTMIPATPEPSPKLSGGEGKRTSGTPKRAPESPNTEPISRPNQGPKRARSSSQTLDHIMAERKRRQELTERFIALSATIPGLNKTDKASVLRAAIEYVKQLQERVKELEKEDKKKGVESVIVIKKRDQSVNKEDSGTSSEITSTEEECSVLPDLEARVLGNEVLIEIHCQKQNGIELKLLDHLENLHLSITGTSVLPFGNSALCITIIAQMGEAYKLTVNDLVKNLRRVVLKSRD